MMTDHAEITAGYQIGEYTLQKSIGTGNFNRVFRALSNKTSKRVALKWLSRTDSDSKIRFNQEIEALKKLDHPCIPKYIDSGDHRGQPYLVESLAAGRSLRKELDRQRKHGGTCEQLRVISILDRVLDALVHMHRKHIFHRDIKDDNIVVTRSANRVMVVDLGFCRDTTVRREAKSWTQVGAPRYSPPRKLRESSTTHRTDDVFAVGVLAYVLLTNLYPWDIEDDEDVNVLASRMEKRPLVPVADLVSFVSRPLSEFISKLLIVDDDKRPTAAVAKRECQKVRKNLTELLRSSRILLDKLWIGDQTTTTARTGQQVLSTRRASSFPNHLNYVMDIVARAKTSVRMLVDCVDHGSLSDPHLHDKVLKSFEQLRDQQRDLRLLICGRPASISKSSPFYGRTFRQNWRDPAFRAGLVAWCGYHHGQLIPRGGKQFDRLMQKYHRKFKERLQEAHVQIGRLPDKLAKKIGLFFWIEDDRYAIFGPSDANAFFRTHDPVLVRYLISTFESNWRLRLGARKYRRSRDVVSIERGN